MILKGKILKGIGGFYYVKTENGIVECRARGVFRKNSLLPYVGDNVEIEADGLKDGYVIKIYDRKNCFIRPPVSNVDKLLIVAATENPLPDFRFIDKMLAVSLYHNVEAALCFTKADLKNDYDVEKYCEIYKKIGYKVFVTSIYSECIPDSLINWFKSGIVGLCGFSGVGKSSLINAITGKEKFEVGEISKKLSRGKHTTRHVELFEYKENHFIVDTPGFSMLELPDEISKSDLKNYFLEFEKHEQECKFSDCLHVSDKYCGVYDAVKNGDISLERYNSYLDLYNTIKDKREWQ